ncbi:unnamed protein product [Timema podura]|uniref:Uncharacterized protein n=1 Tax=Timema podura TaxID=61482 RepID=A0ABN7NRA8_TIMPD|nr:unnamed protein product [Timema podura]
MDLKDLRVPPEKPVIYDAKRRDMTKILEPYNEGSDVNLICEVKGECHNLKRKLLISTHEVELDSVPEPLLHKGSKLGPLDPKPVTMITRPQWWSYLGFTEPRFGASSYTTIKGYLLIMRSLVHSPVWPPSRLHARSHARSHAFRLAEP